MKGGCQERGEKSHIDEEIDVCMEEMNAPEFGTLKVMSLILLIMWIVGWQSTINDTG